MSDDPDLHPREAADQAWGAERERIAREADRRRFKPVAFKDIALNKTRPFLVQGLIPREGLIVIWGPPKCGKTFWALDIALHVALGWPYRGRRVHQGAVVYLAAEGERGLSARIEAFRQRKLGADRQSPPFYLLSTRLHLVTDIDDLIRDIRVTLGDTRVVLIVIDTLNRTITGSENNDADMTAYIDAADKLRQAFSAAVAIIHHCGVNGDRPRGHTALGGAVDAQIGTKKDAAGVHTTVELMKDGPEGETTLSRLVPVDVGLDEDGEPITSLIVEEADAEAVRPNGATRPGKPQPKLCDRDKIALDLLKKAIVEAGTPAPASNHVPDAVKVVPLALWRKYFYTATKENGEDIEQDSQRRSFLRARNSLVARNIVGAWDEVVWMT